MKLSKDGSFNSVKGKYDESSQMVTVVVGGEEQIYFISRDSGGEIIFERVVSSDKV